MTAAKAGVERIGRAVVGKEEHGHRYTLDRLVGTSSTSAVYEATREDGARFAVKMLHPSLSTDNRVVQRFFREARIGDTASHPAIVKVYDDGVDDSAVFLVLELLSGETLDERRARAGGKLPPGEVVRIAMELVDVLDAVHAAGIVHRDVKPQNVFLTEGGELKLLDFGTARMEEDDEAPISAEGLVIGTPSFMSPEQARGERDVIDGRSDVWSLGATLFMALSGEYVHPERDAHQRLLATAMRPARSLASVAPALDGWLVALVDRALAFERKDRWASMAEVRAALAAHRSLQK
jgi:serine/threonine-protein kinase